MKTFIKLLALAAFSLVAIEQSKAVLITVDGNDYNAEIFQISVNDALSSYESVFKSQPWYEHDEIGALAKLFAEAYRNSGILGTGKNVYFVTSFYPTGGTAGYKTDAVKWDTTSGNISEDQSDVDMKYQEYAQNDYYARVTLVPVSDAGSSIAMTIIGLATLLVFSFNHRRPRATATVRR